MALFVGIKPGEQKVGWGAPQCERVVLSVRPNGTHADVNGRMFSLSPTTLVLWHEGECGTWQGMRCAETMRKYSPLKFDDMACRLRGSVHVNLGDVNDYAAAVVAVPNEGVAVVTSSRHGRGVLWLRVFAVVYGELTLTFEGFPDNYRLQFAEIEQL